MVGRNRSIDYHKGRLFTKKVSYFKVSHMSLLPSVFVATSSVLVIIKYIICLAVVGIMYLLAPCYFLGFRDASRSGLLNVRHSHW